MAPGLQLLYASVARDITVPQDALVCFVHWELVAKGYGCLGAGDKPAPNETKSELLPVGWNADKELYTLRYRSSDDTSEILLKAIMVEDSMIINAMDPKLEQVVDLTLNVADYIDGDSLGNFQRVFKKSEELSHQLLNTIISPFTCSKNKPKADHEEPRDIDPLRIPPRSLQPSRQPNWGVLRIVLEDPKIESSGLGVFEVHTLKSPFTDVCGSSNVLTANIDNDNGVLQENDPLGPFAAGGADLDPFGGRSGGMIVDPLRSGFPRSGFDPSRGIPGRLPRGSVPPGARFDPFGPPGTNHPGPDPDHLPPPGYDDMFM